MKKRKISPYIIIILCFLAPILIGALLLCLPISSTGQSLHFVDALFLASSSLSTTGLSPIDISSQLTIFGQSVIAVLLEIGGVGFLTIACFLMMFARQQLGYSTQSLMKEALNRDTMSGMKKIVFRTILFSVAVQVVGAIINLIVFLLYFPDVSLAIRAAVFHAISSYNNAGMDIFGLGDSLITMTKTMHPALNAVLKINTIVLMIIGGIAYVFIDDIWEKKSWKKLSTSTKIVLVMAFGLILIGGILTKIFSLIDGQNIPMIECFFIITSSAGAGFDNLGMNSLPQTVRMLLLLFMYIGSSPGSTGGGIKTTAIFVAVTAIVAFIRGKEPSFGYKRLSNKSVNKAFVLIVVSLVFLFVTATTVCAIEGGNCTQEQIVFETVSAFCTTGFSMGITSTLTMGSKIVLTIAMFVGRVGCLTFISALNKSWMFTKREDDVRYVEENIIIG